MIVGGGFSGAASAIALFELVSRLFRLTILDPADSLGAGIAYGAARHSDVLNVRAEDMRLRTNRPNDFLVWLAAEGALKQEAPGSSFYAPRRLFGAYVAERLAEAIVARPDVETGHLRSSATDIVRGDRARFIVSRDNGASIDADIVVLATGYGLQGAPRFGYGAYEEISQSALRNASKALIAGAGLSAIDAALYLTQKNPSLTVRFVSRRGLQPLAQAIGPALSASWNQRPPESAREALRAVRDNVRAASAGGKDWRAVLNGLRPHTQAIWAGLPAAEKRRFARHLKRHWDVHRHRIPSATALRLAMLQQQNRVRFEAGAVIRGRSGEPLIRLRGEADFKPVDADIVIDCTGHRPDTRAPVVRSLLDNGLAAPDAVGWGLDVDVAGRVSNANRQREPGLYAIGPLGAGSLLEVTASPEIAAQAALAAIEIAATLDTTAPINRVPTCVTQPSRPSVEI